MIRDCDEDRKYAKGSRKDLGVIAGPASLPTVDDVFALNARDLVAACRSVLNWPSPVRGLGELAVTVTQGAKLRGPHGRLVSR